MASRKLDLLYIIFFASHIPATLLVDLQVITSTPLFPYIVDWYVAMSGDPLLGGMLQGKGSGELVWFRTFLWLELLFQLPVFFVGIKGLWTGDRSIYVLLLAYGASTATTTLPCIFYLLSKANELSSTQLVLLLSSYIPYFLIPAVIAIDMVYRLALFRGAKRE